MFNKIRMNKKLTTILLLLIYGNDSFAWSSTINSMFSSKNILPSIGGLNPDLLESVANGAQLAMDECKNVFKWDRWNCPQSMFSKQSKYMTTKEIAYTEAIIAAGIIHTLTKDCSKGTINGCGCAKNLSTSSTKKSEDKKIKDWRWGSCSDDPDFAETIMTQHLKKEENDIHSLIYRHNNQLGREIIRKSMVKKCSCQGFSIGCVNQICWMELAPFKEIAIKLKNIYQQAIHVSFEKTHGAMVLGNTARTDIFKQKFKDTYRNNMLYLIESPNYCYPDSLTGWNGTKGRNCSKGPSANKTLSERRSCRNLCRTCGYRVKKQRKMVTYRCNCKFIWCCEVQCESCVEFINEFFCD